MLESLVVTFGFGELRAFFRLRWFVTGLGVAVAILTLDARPVSGVSFPGWQDSQGQWTAAPKLATGQHRLTATATHPSGWVAPSVSHSFYVMPQPVTVMNGYDEMGNVASRNWSNGKAQTLTWDARGRLVKVVQTGVNPFTWTALYDGLNRRFRTTYTPQGGSEVTTKSVFDPEVEFLELGLAIGENWNWKVYGPDLSGTYGGLQGLGGLEAVVGSDGTTRGIVNDWWGNVVGHVDAPGGAMVWSSAQFLAWGPAPGWGTEVLDGTRPLHELLGYRGLTVDPPGYVHQGLRDYDPQVGRWLSTNSLGHAGSLSLYDYCNNDPLNVFDPDGRFGKDALSYGAGYATLRRVSSGFDQLANYGIANGNFLATGVGSAMSSLTGSLAGMSSPALIAQGLGSAYAANLSVAEGNHFYAANATLNPAFHAMIGFTEWNTGMGYSTGNLGQELDGWERGQSFVNGVNGTVGTVGVAVAGAAVTQWAVYSVKAASAPVVPRVTPDVSTGAGYGVNDPPVRIQGSWTEADFQAALRGRPPSSLGSPDVHHAGQMPGSAIHEIVPELHQGNKMLHPNKFNQGVTGEMRRQDRQLHWWYRAREQGADRLFPDDIYD